MPLNALTLSVTAGVQGEPFRSRINGLSAGTEVTLGTRSAVIGGGVLNGILEHPALPFAGQNVFEVIERDPATGETLTTRLVVTATARAELAGLADTLVGSSAQRRRIAQVAQGDGSAVATLVAESANGAVFAQALNGVTFNPTSRRFAVFGDSRLDQGYGLNGGSSSVVRQRFARGPQHWISALSQGRCEFPVALDFAVSGQSIPEAVATMDTDIANAIAGGAGALVWLCGRNGIAGNLDNTATTLAAEASAIAKLKATGRPVIVIGDWPSAAPTYTYTQELWDVHRALFNARAAYASDPQITYIDGFTLLSDPTSATPFVPSARADLYSTADPYLHLRPRGAALIGGQAVIQNKLAEWFAVPPLPVAGQVDAYGNTVVSLPSINGDLTGTSGNVFAASGGAGQLPDGWLGTSSSATGVTRTCSFTTMDVDGFTGLRASRVVLGGVAPASGFPFVRVIERTVTVTAGQKFYVQAVFEVDAGATGVEAIELGLTSGTETTAHLRWFTPNENVPAGAYKGRWKTEILTVPAGQTSLIIRVNAPVTLSAAVAGGINTAQFRLVEVA